MTPFILALIALTNLSRSLEHLPPLTLSKTLTEVAQIRADILCNAPLSHDYYTWPFIAKGYFGQVGENLAKGFKDAQSLENALMASPTHRANVLGNFKDIGVATCGDVVVVEYGVQAKR